MVVDHKAVIILLAGVIEIFLEIRDILQHLIYGGADSHENLQSHSFHGALIVEGHKPRERMVSPRVHIKFLLRYMDEVYRH